MKKIVFILLVLPLLISACKTVPVTGRKQVSFVSSSEMNALALSSYQETLASSKLSTDTEKINLIKKVGKNIATAVETYLKENGQTALAEQFNWDFNLIEDDNTVNAWCMPGGKVAFYTGILPICQNEVGIAVVMGHEVAHAVAQHSNERMSQEMITQLGSTALSVALSNKSETTQQLALSVYGVGSQLLGILPYSRLHESEADKMGLIFMAMAGYNPEEAPKFWERMAAASTGSTPQFLSTHPSDSKRVQDLNKAMPEALKYYKK